MKHANWFGIIVLYTVVTLLFVYFVPNDSPFSVFTSIFGFVFVAVVPGYCLVNLLFKEGKLDFNMEDEIIRDTLITRDGEIVNPHVRKLLGLGETGPNEGGKSNE